MSAELQQQLIASHEAVFGGLLDATEDLDERSWSTPTGCPGWDVHDQLAHTIGVERTMLGDPPPEVALPEHPSHVRNDYGRYTELDVAARRGVPGEELRAEARTTFDRRLAALAALDPRTLREPLDGPPGVRMRASQLLRTRIFDLTSHEQDVRRALSRLDDFGGPHLVIAIELVLRAWAKLLPDRIDDERPVTINVAGHGPVAILLRDGTLDRSGDVTGAAHVSLEPADLLALAGGRSDAPVADALAVRGDRGIAHAVVAAATITP